MTIAAQLNNLNELEVTSTVTCLSTFLIDNLSVHPSIWPALTISESRTISIQLFQLYYYHLGLKPLSEIQSQQKLESLK